MTKTTTDVHPTQCPRHPAGLLMHLIVTLLAPMFLGVTAGDVRLARMAALETVNAYRASSHADLIAIAQIIAFGLAALGSLSLSMADDLSIAMMLRLRGNAVACDRSAEQNRRALRQSRANDPVPQHAGMAEDPESLFAEACTAPDPDVFLSAAAEQVLAAEARARLRESEENSPAPPPCPPTAEKRHREMWAIAMVKEAGDITAGIPNLPPAEREAATMRAAMLAGTAHDLLYGQQTPQLDPATLAAIAGLETTGEEYKRL
jgi:hypothetical protein